VNLRKGNLKNIELKLISELMKNSRRSDRDLAKALGVSQPTVTRTRIRLEKQGLIEYTVIPNFSKLGYDLLVFTLAKRDLTKHPYDLEMAKKFHEMNPTFIFGAGGESAGYDRIGISVHRNYTEYAKYMQEGKTFWRDAMKINSFIVDLKSPTIVQPLSFKTLADDLRKHSTSLKTGRSNQKAARVVT
jgi:DNA-binding Lrp family transcriptional regulator